VKHTGTNKILNQDIIQDLKVHITRTVVKIRGTVVWTIIGFLQCQVIREPKDYRDLMTEYKRVQNEWTKINRVLMKRYRRMEKILS
jgi:hypothetical protein